MFEIFLGNGYMYPKSILPVSYVVLTTMCGQLQQILDWKLFWNLKFYVIFTYFSSKCNKNWHRDPCKVSFSLYGFIEIVSKR